MGHHFHIAPSSPGLYSLVSRSFCIFKLLYLPTTFNETTSLCVGSTSLSCALENAPGRRPDKCDAHFVLFVFLNDSSPERTVGSAYKTVVSYILSSFIVSHGRRESLVPFISSWCESEFWFSFMHAGMDQAKLWSSKILTLCYRLLATHFVRKHFSVTINKIFYIKMNFSSLIGLYFLLLRPLKSLILPC